MNEVNKTLYIPLFGKAYVSQKGIIISDKSAEKIWAAEGFLLRGKSKSKWLAYYMAIRSAVFDEWVRERMKDAADATVIHIGCGLDSRVLRVGTSGHRWYDVDFSEVIAERRRYFEESDEYKMIEGDARGEGWLSKIQESDQAIVVMEGVSMYLEPTEIKRLFEALSQKFNKISLLMDAYSSFAARMSRYKNPINDVGVTRVYGIDNPEIVAGDELLFLAEREMTPQKFIDELSDGEKWIFSKLYAGKTAKKLYKLFEYGKR